MRKDALIECVNCRCLQQSLFNCLSKTELEHIESSKTCRKIKKGQLIFFEGDLVKGLHCIHLGKVKLYKTLDDGGMQILRISKETDLIGYRGLLGNGRYIASAETIEDSEICFIPKQIILDLLNTNQKFSLQLLSKFASDLSEAEEKSIRFIQKSSKERLAEALLMLESSFGLNPDGFIQINLTRHELAAYAGLATETIIRTLHAWEEAGLLELQKKLIRIKDKQGLILISNTPE